VVNEARRAASPSRASGLLRLGNGNSLAWVLGASKSGEKGAGRGLAADLQKLRSDAGSRYLRLVEAEKMLSPFCGFGIDAVMLKDYGQVNPCWPAAPEAPGPGHARLRPRRHHEDHPELSDPQTPTAGW